MVPRVLPVGLSPTADLSLTIDTITTKYIDYREYTPGSMVIPSCDLLEQQMGDVVPEIADELERAIWDARRQQTAQELTYVLRGHDRAARIIVREQNAMMSIRALGRRLRYGTQG